VLPGALGDFERYYEQMLSSDRIAVGAVGRELAGHVLSPDLRFIPRPAFRWASALTIGLLPEPARNAYGYRWDARARGGFARRSGIVRRLAGALPDRARLFPQAHAALRRVGALG
jgi:uncharacterized protein (DUF2236 family)